MELQQTVTIISKRSEEAALEAYPKLLSGSIFGPLPVDLNKACREKYQEGYEQAEKDLALTWEDVQLLDLYAMECQVEESKGRKFNSSQEFFEEVLQRFKARKEKQK